MPPIKNPIVLLVTVAVLLLIGYYGYSIFHPYWTNQTWNTNYASGNNFHYEGNPDQAISAFEKALTNAPSSNYAAQTKTKLAFQLAVRNRENDRMEAAKLYKEIINDTYVYPVIRANALFEMLEFFGSFAKDRDTLKQVVFNEEPFDTMFREGDINLALRRAYEFADSIYRLPQIEFVIGRMYAIPYYERRETLSIPEREIIVNQLKTWTERGETILEPNLQFYDNDMGAEIYRSNGKNRALLASLGNQTIENYNKAIRLYQKALALVAPEDKFWSYTEGLQIRWSHASTLAERDGKKAEQDIDNLLRPLYEPPEEFRNRTTLLHQFLEQGIRNHYIKQMRDTSQKFQQYLTSRGWNQ